MFHTPRQPDSEFDLMYNLPTSRASCKPRRNVRRGVLIVELLGAFAIMAVLLGFAAQWSGAVIQHRRTVERQRVALDATSNVLASVMAAQYEDISVETIAAMASDFQPDQATWDIVVVEEAIAASPDKTAKRIEIHLQHENGKYDVRPLVTWKYPLELGSEDAP